MSKEDFYKFLCQDIQGACAGVRLSRRSEKVLQDDLEKYFTKFGLKFVRELALSKEDRPDFLFGNGVALECKVENALEKHLHQCKRYAEHEQVTGIILVAMRPYQMPETLSGKPCFCLNFANKCL
jgi:hypothetical protein